MERQDIGLWVKQPCILVLLPTYYMVSELEILNTKNRQLSG